MSEPTETIEPMTRMQILECADNIRKEFNQNGGIISRYGLAFLLDTLETLLDPSQPAVNEEGPAPLDNAETPEGQSWTDPRVTPDAAPDDLVERTRTLINNWYDMIAHPSIGKHGCVSLLAEWLDRANLRPTREEAMALAEEKQRIAEDVSEATCRAMDDAGKIEGRLRARIAKLLTENAELRAMSSASGKRLCDVMDENTELQALADRHAKLRRVAMDAISRLNAENTELRATIADAAGDDEEEVSNPGPRVVWSEVMKPHDGFRLSSTDSRASFGVIFEVGKRYRVTVTEADDTPEEGKDG